MILHVDIKYDVAYRGIEIRRKNGLLEAQWASGDPQSDWQCYLDWIAERDHIIIEGSSVTHFFLDVPGWRMIHDDRGRDIIVPEDRPEWASHAAENDAVRRCRSMPTNAVIFFQNGHTFTAGEMLKEIENETDIAKMFMEQTSCEEAVG